VWRRAALAVGKQGLAALGLVPRAATAPVQHVQYVSRYIAALSVARVSAESAAVIPWGIALESFPCRAARTDELERWAYVGQIEEHKGPQVVVAAVAELRRRGRPVSLTLFGRDTTPFAMRLRADVDRAGLGQHVRFAGALPRETLWHEVQHRAGLLVFATLRDEPFSLTLIEAFASGIPVMTTVTGGTGELVRDGENATVYRTGDAAHLVARWEALVDAPDAALAATRRARAAVEARLDIERMVDDIEAHLQAVHTGRALSWSLSTPAPGLDTEEARL
jgi:glycogen(starch) synthase